MLDILIQNGHVVDGSGTPRFRADVGISGDRIVDVGLLPDAAAKTVIDASGCVVTPGFVDMHSHSDFSLPINPTADSLVHQGITTAVVGQCGSTPAPLFEETREQVVAAMESDDLPLPWDEWSSFGDYLAYLAQLHDHGIGYLPGFNCLFAMFEIHINGSQGDSHLPRDIFGIQTLKLENEGWERDLDVTEPTEPSFESE